MNLEWINEKIDECDREIKRSKKEIFEASSLKESGNSFKSIIEWIENCDYFETKKDAYKLVKKEMEKSK